MNRPDHSTYSEWLELELEGRLSARQEARLAAHLEACPECRAERRDLAALTDLIREARVEVRSDFRDQVVAALPAGGWEARRPRAWGLPVAVFALLAAAAAALVGAGSPQLAGDGSLVGALLAVGGLVQAAVLAGAGLLSASWKGLGIVAGEILASPLNVAAFGVLVVCFNVLLVSLVRRRRAAPAAARTERRPPDPGA